MRIIAFILEPPGNSTLDGWAIDGDQAVGPDEWPDMDQTPANWKEGGPRTGLSNNLKSV